MFRVFIKRGISNSITYRRLAKEVYTKDLAHRFVAQLSTEEMAHFKSEIAAVELKNGHSPEVDKVLTYTDLRKISIAYGIPFIGFGLLDNAIMILAGEYIDVKLGVIFGISTMAAAGFGNLISDVVGLGTVGYVENLAARFGVRVPPLSAKQRATFGVKTSSTMGRILGITIGCLIGMFPLLLFDYSGHVCELPDSTTPGAHSLELNSK